MESFMDDYMWEFILIIAIYIICFFIYYRWEIKLNKEIKDKLTDKLSIIEHQVLTSLINKSRHIKWELKNSEWIRYIIIEKLWEIRLLRCKHYIWMHWICIFIKEKEVEMFSQDIKKYMNDNKCCIRWLFITSCYSTSSRREQAEMNWIDLWDAFRRKWKLRRI